MLYNFSNWHSYEEGLVFVREQWHELSEGNREANKDLVGGGKKNSYATGVLDKF